MVAPDRLVVGISGSSAPHYGIRLLEVAREIDTIETHLVLSVGAERTIELETDVSPDHVRDLADHCYDPADLAAAIASGSFLTLGMVIAPCSMKTLAAVAGGYADNLLTRAADVTIKEGRKLVLVVRETPLSVIHLRNMLRAAEAGCIVLPPVPAFYHQPRSIQDLIDHSVGKALDALSVSHTLFRRWGGGGAGG
jgi:polyprenyl P-hydroxybenzoate/phenylacrylic acid decarboxylase-like protein